MSSAGFAYAAAFSFAYRALQAGMGALLLFLAVQATMVLWGLRRGERLGLGQTAGLALALGGLALLLSPGLSAPPLPGSLLMLGSGVAWGIYSLRGMGSADPAGATADNFLRAAPMALVLCLACLGRTRLDPVGCAYAALSGAVASGLGYVLWYRAMRGLRAASAASVQLSVPVLTALKITEQIIPNSIVKEAIAKTREEVTDGKTIAQPLARSKVFPQLMVDLVKIGEDTGDVPGALKNVADTYENELTIALRLMTNMIEPVMIIVMAVGVGFLLLSVLSAMFAITANIAR